MYPHAKWSGEINGETFAGVRAQVDRIGGIIPTEL